MVENFSCNKFSYYSYKIRHNVKKQCAKTFCFLFSKCIVFLTFLGEELGQPNYAVPFLAPNATGKSILYGVNYASGGGGILNATGQIFVSI